MRLIDDLSPIQSHLQLNPPSSLIHVPLHRWYFARIFQIWSAPVGYEELAAVGLSERF